MKRSQHWESYKEEDHAVWELLASRQMNNLRGRAWDRYLALAVDFRVAGPAIPRFAELERCLGEETGWSIEVVEGIIPAAEFFELLRERRFCSSTWLRRRDQLDYLEEPDMFHDVFGHIPLLFDPSYARFAERFGRLGARYAHDPRAVLLMERLYWFTIEFGLIRGQDRSEIYGAGILSSYGETNHVYSGEVQVLPFSVDRVLRQPFRNTEIQRIYFEVPAIEVLYQCLEDVESVLSSLVAGRLPAHQFRFEEQVGSRQILPTW